MNHTYTVRGFLKVSNVCGWNQFIYSSENNICQRGVSMRLYFDSLEIINNKSFIFYNSKEECVNQRVRDGLFLSRVIRIEEDDSSSLGSILQIYISDTEKINIIARKVN